MIGLQNFQPPQPIKKLKAAKPVGRFEFFSEWAFSQFLVGMQHNFHETDDLDDLLSGICRDVYTISVTR